MPSADARSTRVYTYLRLGSIGRLGNQLWQVAATLDRGRAEDARVALPPSWPYRPLLSIPDDCFGVLPGAVEMETEPGGPYYQTLAAISTIASRLRGYYGLSDTAQQRLEQRHERLLWLTDAEHCTAIHVRRTDYVEHADRFPQLTRLYRRRALEEIGPTRPLIFSDDPDWCEAHLDQIGVEKAAIVRGAINHNLTGPPSTTDDMLDIALMARCRAHVIANSSFSFWGAFLSDQRDVFYPDRWFGDPALQETMWDAIPKSWTQVPC